MKRLRRAAGKHEPRRHRRHRTEMDTGCLVFFGALVLGVLGFLAVACAGNPPPLDKDLIICLSTCNGGCEKVGGTWICIPNVPPPPPPPDCEKLEVPWCHKEVPPKFCGDCQHQPPAARCPIMAPECDDPPPPPDSWDCPFNIPSANDVPGAEVLVKQEGHNVSFVVRGRFGEEHYCQPGLWPEACEAVRTFGLPIPDGHPNQIGWTQRFMQQTAAHFVMGQCTGSGEQCPITFDTFYVIGGVNQNHPRNVRWGAGTQFTDHWTWKKKDGRLVSGQWAIASAHGKGYVRVCIAGGTICGVSKFEVNH